MFLMQLCVALRPRYCPGIPDYLGHHPCTFHREMAQCHRNPGSSVQASTYREPSPCNLHVCRNRDVVDTLHGASALMVVVGSDPRAYSVRTAVSLDLKQITRPLQTRSIDFCSNSLTSETQTTSCGSRDLNVQSVTILLNISPKVAL